MIQHFKLEKNDKPFNIIIIIIIIIFLFYFIIIHITEIYYNLGSRKRIVTVFTSLVMASYLMSSLPLDTSRQLPAEDAENSPRTSGVQSALLPSKRIDHHLAGKVVITRGKHMDPGSGKRSL